jgi:undecaprenyl-diphosphatase
MTGQTEQWDTRLMLALSAERQPWLTWVMKVVSVAGSGAVEIPLALLLIFGLVRRGRKLEARWYAAAVLSGWALYAIAKLVVHRPRPHVITRLMHGAGWYSYPSGHSMLAPLIFGLGIIAWAAGWPSAHLRSSALAVAAVLSVGVGISRVYLGSHYPTDVIGGLLLGTAWSALWLWWGVSRWRTMASPISRVPT